MAAETNLIKSEDLARAREIDFTYRFSESIKKLMEALGVTRKIAKQAGTVESVAADRIVIKKDNIREQYDRAKIEGGVLRACHKRPIPTAQITRMIDEVETAIFNREEKEIPSTVIGEILMDKLKDLDSVAYVRFASVYREFKDVNTFMNELKKMLG